jgi:hypothetical protein
LFVARCERAVVHTDFNGILSLGYQIVAGRDQSARISNCSKGRSRLPVFKIG